MKTLKFVPVSLTLMTCLLAGSTAVAQHLHVNAGAPSTAAGTPLYFINGDSFVTNSGWVFNSVLRSNGPSAGLYDAAVTFTAAGSDGFDGPPAAPGAQLALVVKALAGPEGSSWAFWESIACDAVGENITFSLTAGETNGTNRFLLSQNNGLPGEDPFGHCHGRRFTMSKPGLHVVTFQIVDVSRNGPGGGPIHAPSPLYQMYFQAGATVARLTRNALVNTATFATRSGSRYYLEANPVLAGEGAVPWETVAGPVTGNNHLQTLNETTTDSAQRFYRLRITTP
jgi:hypothetical protein